MKTVLVVDDEEHILTLVELTLTPNFKVIKARDIDETFEKIENFTPDLVLLDLMLPHVSGLEICRELIKKNIPVWILSAKSLHGDIQKGLECGAKKYITKPFDPDELYQKVKTFLTR